MKEHLGETETITLQHVLEAIGEPLARMERSLRSAFPDAPDSVRDVVMHLIDSGGKRVRPMMSLMSARLFGDPDAAIPVAVAAEMIHMATLVHDDVIDGATTRRGRITVHEAWNHQTSVLAGDALLARALVILVDQSSPEIVRIFSEMTYRMCEGEIAQQASLYKLDQTEDEYFDRIEKKTALFFGACCEAGALVAGASREAAEAMRAFGRNIGMAFQVHDDLLDIRSDSGVLGKPAGNDITSGIMTLPVLYLLRTGAVEPSLRSRIASGELDGEDLRRISSLAEAEGGLAYSEEVARRFARMAKENLNQLPPSETADLLAAVADLLLERQS